MYREKTHVLMGSERVEFARLFCEQGVGLDMDGRG